jgi:hypothetical protein
MFLKLSSYSALVFLLTSYIIQVSAWYSGQIYGPGTAPKMLATCFNAGSIPCTPLKTIAAWWDLSQKGGTRRFTNGINVITYSSADGDDITTYRFEAGRGLVDATEFKLSNVTEPVHIICCDEHHAEAGQGDS